MKMALKGKKRHLWWENEISSGGFPKFLPTLKSIKKIWKKSTLPRAINLEENDHIPSLRSKGRDRLPANF
jgi:hypothetical protein